MTSPTAPNATTTDADDAIARVRRTAIALTALFAVALAAWARSLAPALGVIAAGSLMLLSFQGLVVLSRRLLEPEGDGPSLLQAVILTARYVLLGIALYAIVLIPGVGPIPVALGLSVLVLAILLEAIIQLFAGAERRR
jgi:hypothetical protein